MRRRKKIESVLIAEVNTTRALGVEYEFALPITGGGGATEAQNMLANVLTANGLPAMARGYSHSPLPAAYALAVEYDASVQGENRFAGVTYAPIELKTKILTGMEEWEAVVPKALEICRYLGGRATVTAGHHVHVGIPEVRRHPTIIRSLYNLFHRFEPVILGGLVAPSRRQNNFCRSMPDRSKLLHSCRTLRCFQRALSGWDRHYGLNLTHLFEPAPHVEIRHHHSTLDPVKARHWLRFCLRMVDHAVERSCQAGEQVACDRQGLENLLVTVGFKPNSRIYSKVAPDLRETGRYLLMDRWRKLHNATVEGARQGDDAPVF